MQAIGAGYYELMADRGFDGGVEKLVRLKDFDAALAREAALRSENERLELLVKVSQWGSSVEAQAGDEARTELAVLNEHIELLTADLAWSENDSRDQSKELAALREELASKTAMLEAEQKWFDKEVDEIQSKLTAAEQPAPVGWKLVPIEPTDAMIQAGINTPCGDIESQDYRDVYTNMLKAVSP
jgi:hypothetical protein